MSTRKFNELRHIYIALSIIFAFAVLAITIASSLYASQFFGALSSKQGTWGEFGDFFGGTLNPILSFLTIIALLLTIILQVDELKQTRAAAESSAKALNAQLKISEHQKTEQSFFRFYDDIRSDENISKCIKNNKMLSASLFNLIYNDKTKDPERHIERKEVNESFEKITNPGNMHQYVIAKVGIIASILNEFEERDRPKYARLVSTHLTPTLTSFIYNLTSITNAKRFEEIKKSGMIDGAKNDLIFRTAVAECLSPKQLNEFSDNRENLKDSFSKWASKELSIIRLQSNSSSKRP
nr:hypothetical protein [Pseudomonas chengduensis]